MRTAFVAVGLALGMAGSGAGCGGGSSSSGPSGNLTCGYLASDNCWKTTASAATSCLPSSSDTGTLSADGKTCSYATGNVVTFTSALVFPIPDNPSWNFTVTASDGTPCLSYQETPNGPFTLMVQGQTVKETQPGGLGLGLTCPDGTTYSTSNGLSLLSCGDGGFLGGLPGSGWSSSGGEVSFGLLGTSTTSSDELMIFDCSTP
jgi:hypothetical protein